MILVTGFEPFGGHRTNPAEDVAAALASRDVESAVLPVDYARAVARLPDLLGRRDYSAVVLLGLAESEPAFRLERIARNQTDPRRLDNAGRLPDRSQVVAGGPERYASTLPLERIEARLADARFPVRASDEAGLFLCNFAFYLARHLLRDRAVPCGLIHLPPTPELGAPARGFTLAQQIHGVRLAVDEVRRAVRAPLTADVPTA